MFNGAKGINPYFFIGMVVDKNDPLNEGRVKVLSYGIHPTESNPSPQDILNIVEKEDLPWALCLNGTYGAIQTIPEEGDWVFGLFLDGRDAQHPMIFGTIPGMNTEDPTSPAGLSPNENVQPYDGSGTPSSDIANAQCSTIPGASQEVNNALATIRHRESRGDYTAQAKGSSASGAYQFIDSTWQAATRQAGIGTQYQRAKDAPPEIQDRVAAHQVEQILRANNEDISVVPNVWYTGNAAGRMSAEAIAANNGLTADTYRNNWMADYQQVAAKCSSGA